MIDGDDMDDEDGYLPLPPEDDAVTELEDGGAIVRLDDEDDGEAPSGEFYDNLADGAIPDTELATLATKLLDLIDHDEQARKKRDEQQAEGLRRTGLSNDAPGGAEFDGASRVVHPMLLEAAVDFAARAMKEVWPASGPVKDAIPGKVTGKLLEKAARKTKLMNWQMTVQVKEFRSEVEQMLTQLPMGGSQYLKLSWDAARNRPTPLFVAVDDMILPYSATNFYATPRKTHRQFLTRFDYDQRVRSGMYRDVDMPSPGMMVDLSASGEASDRIEGREQDSYNDDGLRTVYECYCYTEIKALGEGVAPYIVTIDKTTQRVLSVYRNWDEGDDSQTQLQHFAEFQMIPWRGAYALGLPHLIGGLSAAATGALRALLDSAHISNFPGMVKLKGKVGGQNRSPKATEVLELEGGVGVDDIRKLAMPMPYNQPSPVLFELLGFLVNAGQGVVRTAIDQEIADGPNTPVGTTMARLEQGMVVFSAIHERMCHSMTQVLDILHRLNAKNLDDRKLREEAGEELAEREDFTGPMDVVPVSDPNIFCEAQRFAQVQAVSQRAALAPDLYNRRKVEERVLRVLKVPDPDELLAPALEPKEQNAVNENAAAALGKPITAFPEQDHLAHIQTHLSFMVSPLYGMGGMFAGAMLPVMLNHLREHLALWYVSRVFDLSSEAIGEDVGDLVKEMAEDKDAEGRKALDKLLAEAGTMAVGEASQTFASLPPVIQQAQQVLQQMQQQQMAPMMQDPRLALEAQKLQQQSASDQAKLQQQAQERQAKLALDAQKLQQAAQAEAADNQLQLAQLQVRASEVQARRQNDAARLQAENQRNAADIQARLAMNAEDNETALTIAAGEIVSGERVALESGTGINPNP